MAYNFFIKVLDGKGKKTYLCRPEKMGCRPYFPLETQAPGSWIGVIKTIYAGYWISR